MLESSPIRSILFSINEQGEILRSHLDNRLTIASKKIYSYTLATAYWFSSKIKHEQFNFEYTSMNRFIDVEENVFLDL